MSNFCNFHLNFTPKEFIIKKVAILLSLIVFCLAQNNPRNNQSAVFEQISDEIYAQQKKSNMYQTRCTNQMNETVEKDPEQNLNALLDEHYLKEDKKKQ